MASGSISDIVELALALLASGALAGLLVGLFGAYGGLVIVPVLHPLLTTLGIRDGFVVYLAAGISLGLVVLTGLRSWLDHRASRSATEGGGTGWLWPISAGAVAASVVVAALPGPEVQLVFTLAVLAGALKVLFLSRPMALTSSGGVTTAMTALGAVELGAGFGGPVPGAGDGGAVAHLLADWRSRVVRGWAAAGRIAATPLAICILLAIPGAAGLAMAAFGEARPPVGLVGYRGAIGVVVILVTAMLLAPLGAELSGQFPKRVLEVSLGLFLLLVAAQFAFVLLG